MISDDLVQAFHEELSDLLESLDRCLLDLKSAPDDMDLIAQVFRDLHTIKGNAAMFGFTELSSFVHSFESAFDKIRSGSAKVTDGVVKIALQARDEIPGLIQSSEDPDGRRAAILSALEVELGLDSATAIATPSSDAAEMADSVAEAGGSFLRFRFVGATFESGFRPELIVQELADLGAEDIAADVSQVPDLTDLDPGRCYMSWSCVLPSGVGKDAIEDVFVFADAEWTLTPLDASAAVDPACADEDAVSQDAAAPVAQEAKSAAEPAKSSVPPVVKQATVQASTPAAAQANTTVRVPAQRLDALMDSVGELVIVEARLTELARLSRDPALLSTAEQITRLASGLRDTTMTMRMVPMKTIVGRFRRLVSEAADMLGKPVRFVVEGEDTEFDKTLIEKLADPIVHLLRNAIDHGVELAGQRASVGKPEEAVIALSAEQSGAEVLVRIRDDGRGMNPQKIKAKAIAMGLIGADAQLTDTQLCNLIFEPGFSTAGQVTEISGRGVGMDVVRRTIEGLRGSISLDTVEGKGTTVTLRLPLTLAIIDGLLVDIRGERYTIPMESVQEIVELPIENAKAKQGGDFLDIRGQFVPFVRLESLLDCTGAPVGRQNVVVINCDGEKVGLVVDRILGTNQTVIKQMSKMHRSVSVVSGASILGDGSVALILDVAQVVQLARRRGFVADQGAEVAA